MVTICCAVAIVADVIVRRAVAIVLDVVIRRAVGGQLTAHCFPPPPSAAPPAPSTARRRMEQQGAASAKGAEGSAGPNGPLTALPNSQHHTIKSTCNGYLFRGNPREDPYHIKWWW